MAVTRDIYELQVETRQASASLGKLSTLMKGFAAVIAVDKLVDFGVAVIGASKNLQTMENQLRLVTTNAAELQRLLSTLRQTAIDNRTAFGDTVDLFVKLRVATEELGFSEERVIGVVTKLSQALQVAGADAATTSSVIRQFSQAMASGTVRGDEFNSLVEGLGPALAIMARESGITVGELRRLSQAGELSAEKMAELLEKSNSLTAAFQSMEPTLDNLEQQFADAFDAALIKIGKAEVAGISLIGGYENALRRLTRLSEDFADVQGSLTDLAPGDIYAKAREGLVSLDAAIYELGERLRNDKWTLGLSLSDEEEQAIEGILLQLSILRMERDAQARAAQQAAQAEDELREALNASLAPFRQYINQAKEYANTDYRTEIEKTTDRIKQAQTVLEQLVLAQAAANGKFEEFETLLAAAQSELLAATERLKELKEEAAKDVTGYPKFLADIVKDAQDNIEALENIRRAQVDVFKQMQEGTITAEVYAEAMDLLNSRLEALTDNFSSITETQREFINGMVDSTEDLRDELASLNMDPLERQLFSIERTLNRDMNRTIEELRNNITAENSEQTIATIARIREATAEQIRQQKELTTEIYESQRTFAYGWENAFKEYQDNATNAAEQAARIFQKATKGMEDAIVDFAKTGKFEFKDFVATIAEELLRSNIRRLIAQTFGSFGGGSGGVVNPFAGFFANGGTIPAGKFGVVGEAGPELVTGPATVTPLNGVGGGTVNYYINAVDAPSFRSLVARDPGFIHAVAQQGAKTVPGRRR